MLVDVLEEKIKESPKKIDTVILCGIETHVCLQPICQDLIARGYNVMCIN